VQTRSGQPIPLDVLQEHARTGLAGYKVPRTVVHAEQIARGPNGKPDYAWAEAVARGESR
jgi:hypothetical protein